MARGFLRYPTPLALLLPAAFLSGATALVYEIVWARKLGIVLGSTTAAAAAVLSSFMLGLAIGAIAVGRRADTSTRPLRWYGILELGIGVYAIMFDSLLDLVVGMVPGNAWIAAFLLLVVPAALMGGTIPVLARAAADTIRKGTGAFGTLYGVNTIGAVAGSLATIFLFLPAWGMAGAVLFAAVLNIVIGVAFWAMGMAAGRREVYEDDDAPPVSTWTGDMERGVALTFFVAGFAGLALQMAWTRLLVFHLEGFTIAFGLMLATYLLGVGTGALGGTWAALQSMNPRRLLARVLLVQAVLAIATFLFTGWIGDNLESMRAGYLEAEGIDFSFGASMFWAAMAVIFPATFCNGMLMPIVARIALADRESIGRHAGVVYAASTFGAVLAPPIAGFFLLPSLGVPATIALLGALLLAGGTYLAFARGLREWVFAGAAAVAFVAVCLGADLSTPLVQRSHVFTSARTPRRLLAYEHGRLGEVAVVEELKDGSRRLYIDGFSAAETGAHYGYMRMQAHLPILLHPKPERVCVIAFGTGTTAGAATVHNEVKRLVCVEIEEAVYRVAPHFAAQNRNVLGGGDATKLASADPDADSSAGGGGGLEVVPLVADGREYVRRGAEKFDVITLEPLMPYTPAAVYLYTREFYEDARKSLAPGGLLCQWIPPQGVSNDDLKRLIASVDAAFPFTSVWYFKHAVLVVGSDKAPRLDKSVVDRTTRAGVLEDLGLAAVGDAAHLIGAHVCSGQALEDALAGAAPMVDDKTDLEFRPLARGLGKRSHAYFTANLEWLASVHQDEVEWLKEAVPNVGLAVRTQGVVLDTLAKEMRGRLEGGARVPASALNDVLARDPNARFARTIHDTRLYEELLAAGQPGEAAQLPLAADRSLAYLALAEGEDAGTARRTYYLVLALRQNALLDPRVGARDETTRKEARRRASALLDELAGGLKGAEALFCRNRARALRGEALEDGEETLPTVPLPDAAGALAEGDVEAAREALVRAKQADFGAQVEAKIMEWFEGESDQRAALAALEAIGSQNTLRAAIRVARSGGEDDLVAVAPIFCARYPTMRRWEQLARNRLPKVRMAAADAAKGNGSRAHLAVLAALCGDDVESVRLSAYVAFRDLEPAADKVGYDYLKPTPEKVAALAALAAGE